MPSDAGGPQETSENATNVSASANAETAAEATNNGLVASPADIGSTTTIPQPDDFVKRL